MFDPPIETWYLWAGLALASLTALGLAISLPTTPPPDAASVAESVDSADANAHPTTTVHALSADEIRLGPYRVWLRDGGATSHATFAYGPITPVRRGTTLWDVLQGTPPNRAFSSASAFRRAAVSARERDPEWQSIDESTNSKGESANSKGELTIRTVSWEGVDVTLVG